MWIIEVEDSIAEQRMILPTAAANRDSTEPVLADFVEQWATHNKVNLEKHLVHCCTGAEHGHDPLVVVKEHGENGRMLLHISCYEITHVVSAEKLTETTGVLSIADVGETPAESASKVLH